MAGTDKPITPADAVCGFVAWLTTRRRETTLSARHESAAVVPLVRRWLDANNLPEPSANYPANIRHPSGVEPHEQRVIDEEVALGEKLEALQQFILTSPIFKGLPLDERQDLTAQEASMSEYRRILQRRISAFSS